MVELLNKLQQSTPVMSGVKSPSWVISPIVVVFSLHVYLSDAPRRGRAASGCSTPPLRGFLSLWKVTGSYITLHHPDDDERPIRQ